MKNKKILLIIIPILLILLVGATIAWLYFTTDILKTNDVLFAKYFMQNEELLSVIQNENLNEQTNMKKTNTYVSNGDLSISIDDGTNVQEMNARTATRFDANTKRLYSEMNLKKGEEDLLKLSFINSDDVYAIKCDEILGNYIGVKNADLKTFAKNMGMTDKQIELIPDSINLNALNEFLEITEEQKQHIINNYLHIITDNITKEKFTKEENINIMINNINKNVTGYSLSIDFTTIKNIIIDCLNKLKSDNVTLALVSNKLFMLGLENEAINITNISKAIDETIINIQKEEIKNEELMKITVYVNEGKNVRTEIVALEKGEKVAKVSIDINSTGNVKKANAMVEQINKYTSFLDEEKIKTVFSQITLEKTTTNTNIINKVKFIPDTTNMMEYEEIETNIEKMQNNTATNISNVTISTSLNENTAQETKASYIQKMQLTSQIEEIMELKNSNTVIINNYSLEELTPFMAKLGEKIMQVIPSKIEKLETSNKTQGITDEAGIANYSNFIIQMTQMGIASGMSITNVNANLTEFGSNLVFSVATHFSKIRMLTYKSFYDSMLEENQKQEEAEKELIANSQAYIDQYINNL